MAPVSSSNESDRVHRSTEGQYSIRDTMPTDYVAVLGDVHGHLPLALQPCRLWQPNHGRHLSAVLQCGDLGF